MGGGRGKKVWETASSCRVPPRFELAASAFCAASKWLLIRNYPTQGGCLGLVGKRLFAFEESPYPKATCLSEGEEMFRQLDPFSHRGDERDPSRRRVASIQGGRKCSLEQVRMTTTITASQPNGQNQYLRGSHPSSSLLFLNEFRILLPISRTKPILIRAHTRLHSWGNGHVRRRRRRRKKYLSSSPPVGG